MKTVFLFSLYKSDGSVFVFRVRSILLPYPITSFLVFFFFHIRSIPSLLSSSSMDVVSVCVQGPVIVGAGPSGLATAAMLKSKGVPSLILERSNCIASLWQLKTYDRLSLHLPKQFCELPMMGFPSDFPSYPSKQQFISYLECYVREFDLRPNFNETVVQASYDPTQRLWRVQCVGVKGKETEYVCRWLVVATGENAEAVVPPIEGEEDFGGEIRHSSSYRSGEEYRGKNVLVVGCGNSGMDMCFDLCQYDAKPSMIVRDTVSKRENYFSFLLFVFS